MQGGSGIVEDAEVAGYKGLLDDVCTAPPLKPFRVHAHALITGLTTSILPPGRGWDARGALCGGQGVRHGHWLHHHVHGRGQAMKVAWQRFPD